MIASRPLSIVHTVALAAWSAGTEVVTWAGLVPAIALAPGRRLPLRLELGERLGRAAPPAPEGRRTWLVHAVSAGEMAAAGALVAEMARRQVGLHAHLTTGTEAGRQIAEALRNAHAATVTGVTYLPWDRPAAMRRWLAALDPEAAVVIEAELWPGLFDAARRAAIPLVVASGRLSDAEAARYRLARPVFGSVLAAAGWIGAQTHEDAKRFVAAGAEAGRVEVAGSLKWDAPARGRALSPGWEATLDGPLVVGASTHAPEESHLLRAIATVRARVPAARLVLAPRDAARGRRVLGLARKKGFRAVLLSDAPTDAWEVLVVDGYGSLPSFYAKAALAFVGGSLAPRGGHSPIEPALLGIPLAMGPHDASCAGASRALENGGALVRISTIDPAASLADAITRVLLEPDIPRQASTAARNLAERERGAAARVVDRVLGLVGETSAPPAV